ncbi:MAG TPA: (d)CMP kinase [Herpetosiphonaceae bacterium]
MPTPSIIALDGPAASGKSTLGQLLATHFGYVYFDTGILYRAVTYLALNQGLELADGKRLADLAARTVFTVEPPLEADGRQYTVRADGEDITWPLRSATVERHVSQVSCHPEVRAALLKQQRDIGRAGQVVMAGRDIGVVVLPEADLKIYLDASVEERAKRRAAELQRRGKAVTYEDVLSDLARRDARDAGNTLQAEDAHALSTDGRTPDQLLAAILAMINQA